MSENKTYQVPVTFKMEGNVPVNAHSAVQALQIAKEANGIPSLEECEHVPTSINIDTDAFWAKYGDNRDPHEHYICANCGRKAPRVSFDPARHLYARLEPGGIFTDVQCTKCGALAFPVA